MSFTAVLLDLDGTLVNTIADLTDALNATLAELGRDLLSEDTTALLIGKGTRALVMRALAIQGSEPDDNLLDQALASFRGHYRRVSGTHATLYPGVTDGLDAFRQMGLKLAVVTNKPTEFTLPLLASSGLAPYFDVVVCGDTCAESKPHPMPLLHACAQLDVTPKQAVMIGDSVYDARAARAAGITALAVPYGYNEGKGVQNLEVDDIVLSIDAAAHWVSTRGTSQVPG